MCFLVWNVHTIVQNYWVIQYTGCDSIVLQAQVQLCHISRATHAKLCFSNYCANVMLNFTTEPNNM